MPISFNISLKTILALWLVAVYLLSMSGCSQDENANVTKDNYLKLQTGMSLDSALLILGKPDSHLPEISDPNNKKPGRYVWSKHYLHNQQGSNTYIVCIIESEKLQSCEYDE